MKNIFQVILFSTLSILLITNIDASAMSKDSSSSSHRVKMQPPLTPMSGIYTIDPGKSVSTTNFQSFGIAVSNLKTLGVSGPVTFNVKDTIFNEQVYIENIQGVSSINKIIFQSDPANTSMPKITFGATSSLNNYVIRFHHVSHIAVEGLIIEATGTTFGYAIVFDGHTSNIVISNDSLKCQPYATSAFVKGISMRPIYPNPLNFPKVSNDSITVDGNYFVGGYAGLRVGGDFSETAISINVTNNIIKEWYLFGMIASDVDFLQCSGNVVVASTNAQVTEAASFSTCDYSEVSENIIRGKVIGGLRSLNFDNCDKIDIVANKVYTTATDYNIGLRFTRGSAFGSINSSRSLIANNMVSVGGDSLIYGFYFNSSDYTNCAYNSIQVYGKDKNSTAFHITPTGSAGNRRIEIYNNSFVNFSEGYAMYTNTTSPADSMNNNNFYTNGKVLARRLNTDVSDLFSLKAMTGLDTRSISQNPLYKSNDDLHATGTALNGKGKHLTYVSNDIDNQSRGTTSPDIGADEFVLASCQPALEIHSPMGEKSADSIFISWNGSTGFTYDIEHGVYGFTQGSGTSQRGITDTFFSATGLQASEDYCFYIRYWCSPVDSSVWAGPYCLSTGCNAIQAPYFESFDGMYVPKCWETYNRYNKSTIWKTTYQSWPNYGALGVSNNGSSGGYAIGVDGSLAMQEDSAIILESPLLDISKLWSAVLKFDMYLNNTNTTFNQKLFVDVYDGISWIRGVSSHDLNNSTWQTHIIPLQALFKNDKTRIRFRVDKNAGLPTPFYSDIIIDNFAIEDLGCSLPDSLSASNLNCDTVSLMWHSSVASTISIIELGVTGFQSGTGTVIKGSSGTLLLGLSKGVVYDAYIADTCLGDTTPFVGPISFMVDTGTVSSLFVTTLYPSNPQFFQFTANGSKNPAKYYWSFGDGSIDTGSVTSHNYTSNGTFIVRLLAVGACDSNSFTDTLIIDGIGIHELQFLNSFKVFPNPTSDVLNISFVAKTGQSASLRVFDTSSKEVMNEVINCKDGSQESFLDLVGLKRGLYFLQIELEGSKKVFKIIKQ